MTERERAAVCFLDVTVTDLEKITTSSPGQNLPALSGPSVPASGDLPALAAGLVHEVKNPLAAIHMHLQLLEGYLEEIQDPELRDKTSRKVQLIKKEIHGLNHTLHSFISMLRPQTVEAERVVDLNRLIEEVVQLVEPQALREGIELHYTSGAAEPIKNVDPSFIKQTALNLILNSIQAFQESNVPFEERRIDVETGQRAERVYFRVSDNGPGMPAEIQERMFEPFFSTKKGKGSGLGLTLVQRMIGEMGGRLEVHSAPGQGASFAVILDVEGPRSLPA